MKISIESPDVKIRRALLEFTQKHVMKFSHLTDRLIAAHVMLRTDKSSTGDHKLCEIRVSIPGNDFFASKRAETFEEAVVLSCEALKKQIVSWKERTRPFHI